MRVLDFSKGLARGSAFELLAEFRLCRPRINPRDIDPEGRHFTPERFREGAHAIFAGRISCNRRRGNESCHRGHVDDMSLAASQHVWKDSARDQHRADQVDPDHGFDISLRLDLFKPVDGTKACIVEQDVNLSVKIQHGLHHRAPEPIDQGGPAALADIADAAGAMRAATASVTAAATKLEDIAAGLAALTPIGGSPPARDNLSAGSRAQLSTELQELLRDMATAPASHREDTR